jgi:hypothetical protein
MVLLQYNVYQHFTRISMTPRSCLVGNLQALIASP